MSSDADQNADSAASLQSANDRLKVGLAVVALLALAGCQARTAPTASGSPVTISEDLTPDARGYTYLMRDEITGCEYFVTAGRSGGGITPRMREGGGQVCRPASKASASEAAQ